MIKALLLIFEPATAWERVVRAERSMGFILVIFLLPLLAWAGTAEGYSLVHWGRTREFMTQPKVFTASEVLVYEIAVAVITLSAVFIGAKMVKMLGETFHGRHSYRQAFTVVAYGLSPLLTCRMLDAFPNLSLWVGWAIGMALSAGVLYQGVPRIMLPDPPHAFGLYLMSSILLTITTGLVRYLEWGYLRGDFKALEHFVTRLTG